MKSIPFFLIFLLSDIYLICTSPLNDAYSRYQPPNEDDLIPDPEESRPIDGEFTLPKQVEYDEVARFIENWRLIWGNYANCLTPILDHVCRNNLQKSLDELEKQRPAALKNVRISLE